MAVVLAYGSISAVVDQEPATPAVATGTFTMVEADEVGERSTADGRERQRMVLQGPLEMSDARLNGTLTLTLDIERVGEGWSDPLVIWGAGQERNSDLPAIELPSWHMGEGAYDGSAAYLRLEVSGEVGSDVVFDGHALIYEEARIETNLDPCSTRTGDTASISRGDMRVMNPGRDWRYTWTGGADSGSTDEMIAYGHGEGDHEGWSVRLRLVVRGGAKLWQASVPRLAVGPAGSLWALLRIPTANDRSEPRLARLQGSGWSVYSADDGVLLDLGLRAGSLAVDAAGFVWSALGGQGDPLGIARFDGQTWSRHLPGALISDIAIGPDGLTWTANDGRIHVLRPEPCGYGIAGGSSS